MNTNTFERYEQIGAFFALMQVKSRITEVERVMLGILQHDRVFTTAIEFLKIMREADDYISIKELAGRLNAHEETVTSMIRALKNGGFEMIEASQSLDSGGRILLFYWEPKASALTSLVDSF